MINVRKRMAKKLKTCYLSGKKLENSKGFIKIPKVLYVTFEFISVKFHVKNIGNVKNQLF